MHAYWLLTHCPFISFPFELATLYLSGFQIRLNGCGDIARAFLVKHTIAIVVTVVVSKHCNGNSKDGKKNSYANALSKNTQSKLKHTEYTKPLINTMCSTWWFSTFDPLLLILFCHRIYVHEMPLFSYSHFSCVCFVYLTPYSLQLIVELYLGIFHFVFFFLFFSLFSPICFPEKKFLCHANSNFAISWHTYSACVKRMNSFDNEKQLPSTKICVLYQMWLI